MKRKEMMVVSHGGENWAAGIERVNEKDMCHAKCLDGAVTQD
jgi:hypothetical protein